MVVFGLGKNLLFKSVLGHCPLNLLILLCHEKMNEFHIQIWLLLVRQIRCCSRQSATQTSFRYQYQIWADFRNRRFFSIFSPFFSIFFSHFLGKYKFLKVWNWTEIFNNNLNNINVRSKFFSGPFKTGLEKYPILSW